MRKICIPRERLTLYIAAGAVLSALVFNSLIEPVLTKSSALNKEINLAIAKLKKYTRLLSQKEYLQNKYSKFSLNLDLSGQKEDTLVNALAELENLAKVSSIRILDIRPQPVKTTGSYKEAEIDLRTEGDMKGYIRFIYEVENSLSLFRVKRMQLNAKPNTTLLDGSFSIFKPL